MQTSEIATNIIGSVSLEESARTRVEKIMQKIRDVQTVCQDGRYYRDDRLGQLEVHLSSSVQILTRLLKEKNFGEVLRMCDYLNEQYHLFNIRRAYIDQDVSQVMPLSRIEGIDQAMEVNSPFEITAVGLPPQKIALPNTGGFMRWENGAGAAMTLLMVKKGKTLTESAELREGAESQLVLYRDMSIDAFFAALIVKGVISSDERTKKLLTKVISHSQGKLEDPPEIVKRLLDMANNRDISGIKEILGEKKNRISDIIQKLGNVRIETKERLFLFEECKKINPESVSNDDISYMASSKKAILERIAVYFIIKKNNKAEYEEAVVDMLVKGSGDQNVAWKAGNILSQSAPKKPESYKKLITFIKANFKREQRNKRYICLNIIKNGNYPEVNEFLKQMFINKKIEPEFQVIIIYHAKSIFGANWRETVEPYMSDDPIVKEAFSNAIEGIKDNILEVEIDLEKRKDRLKGALFGHAIGDAIGAPVEILKLNEIEKRYGTVSDFIDFELKTLPIGEYTDDTALTFCGMESILENRRFDPRDYAKKLGSLVMAIDEDRELNRHFSEGTIAAMRRLSIGQDWRFSGNKTGKNGAAIRMVPIAILALFTEKDSLKKNVIEASEPTHKDKISQGGALIMALAIRYCLEVEDFNQNDFLKNLENGGIEPIYKEKLSEIKGLLERNASVTEAQKQLGTSGLAIESVPYALFCFLKNPYHFKDIITAAVNVDGDSDSIAAMAGSLCGALNGFSKLPLEWVEKITCKDKINGYFN